LLKDKTITVIRIKPNKKKLSRLIQSHTTRKEIMKLSKSRKIMVQTTLAA